MTASRALNIVLSTQEKSGCWKLGCKEEVLVSDTQGFLAVLSATRALSQHLCPAL